MTVSAEDPGFYSLIMAAMRKADSKNMLKLQWAWPDIYVELQQRYDASGGVLEGDKR